MTISDFRTKPVFIKRLLVTICLVAVYRLGLLLPLPFLDAEALKGQFGIFTSHSTTDGHLSIFLLGIMPYVSAYILVELTSLCIPFLKKLRSGDFKGRLKLKRISLVLALGLATYQATSIVSSLNSMDLSDGKSILNISTTFEHVILVCVMVGSFYLLVAICEMISRFGIGHGISIIILSGICGGFIGRVPMYFKQLEYHDVFSYFIAFIVFCALIAFTFVLLKNKIPIPCYHEKDNKIVGYFQLNQSPSSMVALTYAASIVMLPPTLSHFFGNGSSIANYLNPGSIGYNLISIICVFMFSFLFGWAFLHPRRRISKMRERGWHIADMGTTAESFILKRMFIYNLPWTIFLCIMVVVPSTLISVANVPFYLGGSSIPIIVAVSLDLIGSFRFYSNGINKPVKIAEFHDIYDANMIQNHMKAAGIKSYLQCYHHRLLRYFFGPHLDMGLIIDARDKEKAQTLIKDFYNGLGLCQKS
ncbi:MAG: hypothetical protein ABIK92_16240 [Pseudomonadota bacterium]